VKVLLVSFFFPPAGGGGVQRPLKLASHLPALGVETHVLAPDDPRWVHGDGELPVPTKAWVHRARFLGPQSRRPAEELRGRTGLDYWRRRAALTPQRLLVPDAKVTWSLTAIPAAIRLVREHGIDAVITTSPPPSVHLIGAAVKRATGAAWIADLRDSIAANPHRRAESAAVRLKEKAGSSVAGLVARRADAVVTVSEAIAEEVRELEPSGPVRVIPNACDFEDFEGIEHRPSDRFRITHAGSFFGKRTPRPFLTALAESGVDVVARFVGDFRSTDREWAETLGLGERLELVPYATHRRALELERDSEALLLLIPDSGGRGRGVLSGKLFEYLAAERPILATVPPDGEAARVLRETGAGIVVAPEDVEGIKDALRDLHGRWSAGTLAPPALPSDMRERLSRRARTEELVELLHSVRVTPRVASGAAG
jgi:glycosyltransferase involved in cell wall biosynthesis